MNDWSRYSVRKPVQLAGYSGTVAISSIVPEDKQPIKPGSKSKIEKPLEYIKTLPENKQQKILALLESALEIES